MSSTSYLTSGTEVDTHQLSDPVRGSGLSVERPVVVKRQGHFSKTQKRMETKKNIVWNICD